jgi:iron(III) transport system substrate-binding protein
MRTILICDIIFHSTLSWPFTMKSHLPAFGMLVAMALMLTQPRAQEKVLNLYSARHYQTDEALYSNFTKQTGIKINRIEAGDEPLLERLRNEGKNSPADVLMLVDASRLWRAQIDGMFAPVKSKILESRVPEHLRGKDDGKGSEWFAISTRARIMVYNKAKFKASDVANYQDLAGPTLKGAVCTRSAFHPYMLSFIGAMSEHLGPVAAENWAKGVVSNFARPPRGGDTDQIKAVATGECGVALTNTYYLVRLMRSDKSDDQELMSKIGFVMPNQQSFGTHMNISGAGVLAQAKNKANAVKFIEYLLSDEAQAYLAEGNNEWPVVGTAQINNPALKSLGNFKKDNLSIAQIGRAQIEAAKISDRVGWR